MTARLEELWPLMTGQADSEPERPEVLRVRRQHKILKANRYWMVCSCGHWEGYVDKYGPTSYAVHLANVVYEACHAKRDG